MPKETALSSQPYRGTKDFYPEDILKRNYIFDTWRKVLTQNGYSEYDASIIENAELYLVKSGEELGSKQLYSFVDRGDRKIALRPEMTPTLARMVAERYGELRFPLRWFSIPNCFRYERPQKGRSREFWQLNVDLIGHNGGPADIEILYIICDIFKAFQAPKESFTIRFNHRELLDLWLTKNTLIDRKEAIYKVFDDWLKLTPEAEGTEALLQALGQMETNETFQKVFALLEPDLANRIYKVPMNQEMEEYLNLGSENFPELKLLLGRDNNFLDAVFSEFNVVLDPTIVRGLAYYTGLVFECFDNNPDNNRALFGGGRYDNLMELFGKPQTPAIGFGMGNVPMEEFLTGWNLWPNFSQNNLQKVGIMPFSEQDLFKIYTKIIPEIIAQGKTYEIDYDFSRSENKRWESLKKRSCSEIMKLG